MIITANGEVRSGTTLLVHQQRMNTLDTAGTYAARWNSVIKRFGSQPARTCLFLRVLAGLGKGEPLERVKGQA